MAKGTTRNALRTANRINNKDDKLRKDLISSLLTKCTNYGNVTDDDLRDILSLIDRIEKLEEPLSSTLPRLKRDSESLSKFVEFCSSNGVDTTSISLMMKDDGECGVQAARDIKEDQLILSVPNKLILSVDEYIFNLASRQDKCESDASFIDFVSTDAILREMPNLVLAMILMKESTDVNSFWQPYINILPIEYKTPLYFNLQQFTQLKCTSAYEESKRTLRSIARQYSYLWTQMQSHRSPAQNISFKKHFTFQFYRWAVSTVMTRQNVIPSFPRDANGDDGKNRCSSSHALIPLWDMFNHRKGKLSTDFQGDAVICYSMSAFDTNDEIFIHYGDRANRHFFLHNGFVDVSNDCDNVLIRLGVSRSDPLASEKIQLCNKLKIPSTGSFILKRSSQPPDSALIAFLRVFHMSQDDLQFWLENDEELQHIFTATDERFAHVDALVTKFLSVRASLLLKSYPCEEEIAKVTNENIRQLIQIDLSVFTSYLQS